MVRRKNSNGFKHTAAVSNNAMDDATTKKSPTSYSNPDNTILGKRLRSVSQDDNPPKRIKTNGHNIIVISDSDDDNINDNKSSDKENVPEINLKSPRHDHVKETLQYCSLQYSDEDDSDDEDFKVNKSRISISQTHKVIQKTDQEITAKLEALEKFLEVITRYSQYLTSKIDTSKAGKNLAKSDADACESINKKLSYFNGELRPYQLEGVAWLMDLYENTINGILADEMGLGKTIQIVALFAHLYEKKITGPFLIVAPLSVLDNWQSEFKFFAPKLPVVCFHGSQEERQVLKRKILNTRFTLDGSRVQPIILCSYQTPSTELHFFEKFSWEYIIVDEGHRVKNSESKLSKDLSCLKTANKTLLTGTPLQNDITELWSLFHFLMPNLFSNVDIFSTLIELDDLQDKGKLLENKIQTKLITTIHKVLAPFMLRREKSAVLKDLPPKKHVIIYCPLTEMQKYLYLAVLHNDTDRLNMLPLDKPNEILDKKSKRKCTERVHYKYDNFNGIPDKHSYRYTFIERSKMVLSPSEKLKTYTKVVTNEHVPINIPDCVYKLYVKLQNTMMMLKKIVCHGYLVWEPRTPDDINTLHIDEDLVEHSSKLKVLDALLPKLKSQNHKVLIFSTFVTFLDLIEHLLDMRNYKYSRLDGNVGFEERVEQIKRFKDNKDVFVFLLSTRAGGLGLNLTAADTVILMDRDWNPMADLQAEERCHRIGQNKPVVVYSLTTKNTIDEVIINRGNAKRLLEKVVLQEGKFKTMKKKFGNDDIKELIEMLKRKDNCLKVKANGLFYTDEELNEILDRSDLIEEMERRAKENKK